MRRIRRQLVAGIHDRAARRPVADWIVGKALRSSEQGMRGGGQAVEIVVAEGLRASLVRERHSVPHAVIEVVGLINLTARGRNLMQDVGDLRGGIIAVGGADPVRQREGGSPAQRVIGERFGTGWTRETRQPVQHVIHVGVRGRAACEGESVPVLVIRVRQRDTGLMA